MVHVSADAAGRHKMLAYSTTTEPTFTGIDSIIKVNSKQVLTFNDSSSPSSATTASNHHHNALPPGPITPPTEFQSRPSNISTPPSKPLVPKTILKNTLNSLDKQNPSLKYHLNDKMFAEEDRAGAGTGAVIANAINNGNNGNANYIADTINSNSSSNTTTSTTTTTTSSSNNRRVGGGNVNYDQHDLDLISHGLTDSVCETIKLLEGDMGYDKKCSTTTASLSSGISASSSSTSGGVGGGIDEVMPSNVVYTEEIVISTARSNSNAVTGMTKPGIMKTFSSFSSSPAAGGVGGGGPHPIVNKNRIITSTEQWKSELNEEGEEDEAMSQSNESEETPLLTAAEQSSSSTAMATHASDNISNESLPGSGGGFTNPSSAMHKVGKVINGTKATGLKR